MRNLAVVVIYLLFLAVQLNLYYTFPDPCQPHLSGFAQFVDIKEGLKTKDSTEVIGSLAGGEEFLLHATDEIRGGKKIK